MPVIGGAASIAALAAAVGATVVRSRLADLWRAWLDTRNRRIIARFHERAITTACAAGCSSPVRLEIDHEEKPTGIRLHLRLTIAAAPGRDRMLP